MKLLILIFLLSFQLQATTFKKVPLDNQIKEADGIIIGHFMKARGVKLEDGSIATQMIFKMDKEFGLQSDLFGMDEVIIHYPGGTVGNETSLVQGVPHFVVGEKVALLSKNVNNRYWGLNLAYGSFKVINYGRDVILVNSLFPEDPIDGQLNILDFEKKVRAIKGSNLKVITTANHYEEEAPTGGRSIASVSPGKNRSVASKAEASENDEGQPDSGVFWWMGLLAILGGFFRMFKQRSSR